MRPSSAAIDLRADASPSRAPTFYRLRPRPAAVPTPASPHPAARAAAAREERWHVAFDPYLGTFF
jgi:hypothetical protein